MESTTRSIVNDDLQNNGTLNTDPIEEKVRRISRRKVQIPKGTNNYTFRISYISPIFKKSQYAYVHGHDEEGDIQIDFYFPTSEEKKNKESYADKSTFSALKKGSAYKIKQYEIPRKKDPESKPPLRVLKAIRKTKIDLQEKSDIPIISPEITNEKITFCDSVSQLENYEYPNIIGLYLDRLEVIERDKDGKTIRVANKIFLQLSSGDFTGVCLWDERFKGFNFQKDTLVIFRNLERPSIAIKDRYDLKCTFYTSILLFEEEESFTTIPQAKEFENLTSSQETENNLKSTQESQDGIESGAYLIMAILKKKDQSLYYHMCAESLGEEKGYKCGKKTEKKEKIWTCGEHNSKNPVLSFRLRVLVENYKTGELRRVSFLGENGEKLLGENASNIRELCLQNKNDLVEKALNEFLGKSFYMSIKQNDVVREVVPSHLIIEDS